MASLIVFAILVGVAGVIFLLSKMMVRFSAGKEDLPGITTQNNKSDIRLIPRTQLQMKSVRSRPNRAAGFFRKFPLPVIPKRAMLNLQ
ncbi:MAG: hypothetical protein JWP38_1342 [Herbaspirillum sp.]|nr:hypothetical protein [Herbaspirillum sp.]